MADILSDGIKLLGLGISPLQLEALNNYVTLLLKWNRVYSLTAITDTNQVKILHLLDGLSVIPHLPLAGRVLDVGSGMGVPGVIIAIMCPYLQVTLIDSNGKKAAFLRQVKIELGLTNLEVINQKVEAFKPQLPYEIIISRAFANLQLFVELTGNLLKPDGYYLAMKTHTVHKEITRLNGYKIEVINLRVPYLTAPRVLVKMLRL